MKYVLKENEKEARERLRAFWAGESLGRPALYVTASKHKYDFTFEDNGKSKKELDFSPEWHIRYNEWQLGNTVYLAEAMPGADVIWGANISLIAVLCGSDYEYDSNGQAWVKPMPDIWERELPKFDKNHSVIKSLENCYYRLAEVIGNKGYINPPVMLDSLTTLSLLRTPEVLCLDIIERPEIVKKWSSVLTDIYIQAYEHFYQLLLSLGYGETSSWIGLMAEGRFETVQCDFAVMISRDMFKEFVMPDLCRVAEYLDYSLYHLDGTSQMRFIDLIASIPKLNGVQWNPEPGAGSPVSWIDAFKEIRKRNLSLYIYCNKDEAIEITKELGPDGLMFVLPHFGTIAEAEQAIKEIERACQML